MNKKIKVIELLNEIANREEIPRVIKVRGNTFKWEINENGTGYYNVGKYKGYDWLENYISLDSYEDLNTEVEILEDNIEEIEELPENIDEFGWLEVKDKINELVKAINSIRKDKSK